MEFKGRLIDLIVCEGIESQEVGSWYLLEVVVPKALPPEEAADLAITIGKALLYGNRKVMFLSIYGVWTDKMTDEFGEWEARG